MAMTVKNNLGAVRTTNTLDKNEKARNKSLGKVSSGMKINSAQDDASSYAISERMRVRLRALDQANQNTQNDMSMMKTAGGAVDNTVEILRALKEKAINAANDSNTDEDRLILQKEAHQLIDQINDNALVQFNGKYLLNGTKNNALNNTRTVLLNQTLQEGTIGAVNLTDLKNRAGDSLEIQSSDLYQVSWVRNGVVGTTSGQVGSFTLQNIVPANGTTKLAFVNATTANKGLIGGTGAPVLDKYGQNLYTPDNKSGVAIASHYGYVNLDDQIAGFTIRITDNQGNVNKSANAALEFKLYQRAENATGDQSLTFHIGSEANVAIKVGLTDMRAHALGLEGNDGSKLLFVPIENANAAINVFDNALTMSLDQATSIGAVQQRLEYTAANLTTASENVQAAESVIRDADMAKEMTEYTKNSVLSQAAQAMLAQANQSASSVISLLQ